MGLMDDVLVEERKNIRRLKFEEDDEFFLWRKGGNLLFSNLYVINHVRINPLRDYC